MRHSLCCVCTKGYSTPAAKSFPNGILRIPNLVYMQFTLDFAYVMLYVLKSGDENLNFLNGGEKLEYSIGNCL